MKWHFTGVPESDPYKPYLVVYCPWDFNRKEHDRHLMRYDIATYYGGDGAYKDKPWHLSITMSAMEKEIIAWKPLGDIEGFEHWLPTEPKPCPICGIKPMRKQLRLKLKKGIDRYKFEHHKDGTIKWTWLECEKCGLMTEAYCDEQQSTDKWNEGEFFNSKEAW